MAIDKMITSLKSILLDTHQHTPKNNDACLKDQQSGMTVKLTEFPKDGLVFSIPSGGKSHIGTVKAKRGYKKSCDQLIFVPCSGYTDVYFVELKKSLHPEEQGIPEKGCDQILFTIPVLEYLISMVNIHYGGKGRTKRHYVVIGERESPRLDKQGVKPSRPKSVPYKGKRFKIIISSSTVSFKHLK